MKFTKSLFARYDKKGSRQAAGWLFFGLLFCLIGCTPSGSGIVIKKINPRSVKKKVQITAYGIARGKRSDMPQSQARAHAISDLARQVLGYTFTFDRSNEEVEFFMDISGFLKNYEVRSYLKSSKLAITICELWLEEKIIIPQGKEGVYEVILEDSVITVSPDNPINLGKNDRRAVKSLIRDKFPDAKKITGRLYTTDLKLALLEEKGELKFCNKYIIVVNRVEN